MSFGLCHTAYDCAAVIYVIANMQKCSDLVICFGCSGIIDNQIKTLTDILANKHGKLQVSSFDLRGNRIGAESINSIATPLEKSCFSRLSYLDLSLNPLGVSSQQALEDAVSSGSLANLRCLDIQGSLTSDADINGRLLATFAAHCHHLWTLDLSQNNLGIPGASAVATIISGCNNYLSWLLLHTSKVGPPVCVGVMDTINLNETKLGDEGLSAFIDNLEGPCHICELGLKGNDICATGASYLADSVCMGMIMMQKKSECTSSW